MIKLANPICLITGATSGIGEATAGALAAMGATTVLVARNRAKGEATANQIRQASGNERVEVLLADLSSQASIRGLAAAFGRDLGRLDVLVNCASAFFRKRRVSIDGLEMTFALNHLAYFLLTNLMLEQLKRSGSARILNVTAPATTRIDFDDLQAEHRYRAFKVFGASKTAELMFTFELRVASRARGELSNGLWRERSPSRSIPTSNARKTRSSSQSIRSSAKVRVFGFPQYSAIRSARSKSGSIRTWAARREPPTSG